MEILCLGDIHATERPPSSCTDTYSDDILSLLRQTARIANARKVAAAVWAGDVFHSKAPARSSHRLVQRLIGVLGEYECPVYVTPGNHDMQHDRLESVGETQPLGVLMRSGLLRPLIGWENITGESGAATSGGGLPLYGVPWQQEWTDEAVSRVLAAYREQLFAPALVVTHAPLYPPGLELEWEHYPAEKWAAAMGGEGFCYYGHVHERHGIWGLYDEANQVTFCNPGALSRGSLHEHNLTRTPACVIWDSNTGKFTEIPLDARPPEQVFRLQESRQITDMHGRLDQFLASVGSASLEVLSVESVVEHIRSLGLSEPETTLATELLMEAAHDC
jgi:Icc-related predicted phosphoesterase